MAVLDFPSDTSQSPYELNGITYNWDGQKWVASAAGGGGGGDGSSLTLQEVTDNGNTTTNGAKFGGKVESGIGNTTSHGAFVGNCPLGVTSSDASGLELSYAPGDADNYMMAARIRYDGSATFSSGDVVVNSGGRTDINRTVGATDPSAFNALLISKTDQNSDEAVTFKVQADGTAKIGGSLGKDTAGSTETGNITLNADGSAEFAGDVKAGERDPSNNTDARGVRIAVDSQNGGVYTQCRGDSPGPGSLMAFQALTGDDERFVVKYDGTANFEGDVTLSGGAVGDADDFGVTIAKNGYFAAKRPQYSTNKVFIATRGTTETISMVADGSADFAGNVNIGGDLNTTSAIRLFANGAVSQRSDLANASQAAWQYYNGGYNDASRKAELKSDGSLLLGGTSPNDQSIKLNADGSASFAGDVTTNGYLYANGDFSYLAVNRTNVQPTTVVGQFQADGSDLLTIFGDGSATFAGDVTAPNLPDDYEEGSWVPKLVGDATYTVQTGTYTKIGRLVNVSFQIIVDQLNSSTGGLMEGLPFLAIVNPTQNGQGYGNCFINGAASYPAGNFGSLMVTTTDNSSRFTFFGMTTSLGGIINPNLATNGSDIRGNVTYLTS